MVSSGSSPPTISGMAANKGARPIPLTQCIATTVPSAHVYNYINKRKLTGNRVQQGEVRVHNLPARRRPVCTQGKDVIISSRTSVPGIANSSCTVIGCRSAAGYVGSQRRIRWLVFIDSSRSLYSPVRSVWGQSVIMNVCLDLACSIRAGFPGNMKPRWLLEEGKKKR